MCALYQERQEALIALLDEYLGGIVSVEKPAGGMQIVAQVADTLDDESIVSALFDAGVVSRPLSAYYLGAPARRGVLLGYAAYGEPAMRAAVEVFARVLGDDPASRFAIRD
jgi:GntR family transcriptional regulator/MocR family aminotransferase